MQKDKQRRLELSTQLNFTKQKKECTNSRAKMRDFIPEYRGKDRGERPKEKSADCRYGDMVKIEAQLGDRLIWSTKSHGALKWMHRCVKDNHVALETWSHFYVRGAWYFKMEDVPSLLFGSPISSPHFGAVIWL